MDRAVDTAAPPGCRAGYGAVLAAGLITRVGSSALAKGRPSACP